METKKRRNSILKKQLPNEEDTTGDITTRIKRRISFSGKKSVKEFIAGEEEATIWGTSYEESAESLQVNSTETGLVNVNEKRIVLRNRRVVVNSDLPQKRRSRNKILVAANDKENMFVPQSPVQLPEETTQLQPTPKAASPVRSELQLAKSQQEDAKTQTLTESLDRVNICSNTFDFINFSGLINRSITIERSVDVTLNENELQMYKFRVPVAATDVTPNLSLSSLSDASPTSIFSRSIQMSEEDKQMLKMMKMMREGKAPQNPAIEIKVKEILEQKLAPFQPANATIAIVADMEESVGDNEATLVESTENKAQRALSTLCANQSMNVTEVSDVRTTSRKTILNAEDIDADMTARYKSSIANPATGNDSQPKSKPRATIHMNQTMNVSQNVHETRNLKRKTVTKRQNMEEGILRMDLPLKPQTKLMDCSSMDLNSPLRKKLMHNATSKPMDVTGLAHESAHQIRPTRRQTIHFESAEMDASAFVKLKEAVFDEGLDVSMEESIAISPSPICNAQKQNKSRYTIHDTGDARMDVTANLQDQKPSAGTHEHEAVMQHSKASKSSVVRRQTVHDADDIVADATLSSVHMESAANLRPIEESKPSVIRRQTIYDAVDIAADATLPSVNKELAVDFRPIEESKPSLIRRQTIYDAVDIVSEATLPPSNRRTNKRESIYTPTNIIEESPVKVKSCSGATGISSQNTNTVQDPPNEIKQVQATTSNETTCQSIRNPSDKIGNTLQSNKTKIQKRRDSIHTPVDIVEDSPKVSRTNENAIKTAARLTLYTASDMIEESPKAPPERPRSSFGIVASREHHQSTLTPSEMIEDSPKGLKSPPRNQPPSQAGKVFVKHMNLQKALTANEVALRALKNKHTEVEHTSNDSFMDLSIPCEPTVSEHKMNFYQLNEEMLRGEIRAFTKPTNKMSLFDRLEQKPPEVVCIDSFMDKSNATACPIQPAKTQNPIKDYTIDALFGKQYNSLLDPSLNPSQDVLMNFSSVADCRTAAGSKTKRQTVHMAENLGEETNCGPSFQPGSTVVGGQKNRQTIYFNNDNEIEVSRIDRQIPSPSYGDPSSSQRTKEHLAGEATKPQTIHLQQNDLDENVNDQPKRSLTVRNESKGIIHKTINFNENGDMEESVLEVHKPFYNLEKASVPLDEPTMDLSVQETNPQVSQINFSQGKGQRNQRLTIHFNENAELDESLSEEPKHLPIAKKVVGWSNHNPKMLLDELKMDLSVHETNPQVSQINLNQGKGQKTHRLTIHFNENAELDESLSEEPKSRPIAKKVAGGYNHNPTMDLSIGVPSAQDHQAIKNSISNQKKRQTIHFNENNDLDQSVTYQQKPIFGVRKTENWCDDPKMDLSKQGCIKQAPLLYQNLAAGRQTINFNEHIDLEESLLQRLAPNTNAGPQRDDDTMDISLKDSKMSVSQAQRQRTDSTQYARPVGMTECHQNMAKPLGASYQQSVNKACEVQSLLNQRSTRVSACSNQDLKADKETNRTLVQSKQVADVVVDKRHTLHLHQDMEFVERDDQTNMGNSSSNPQSSTTNINVSIAGEAKNEEHSKFLPKPRRLTVLDCEPLNLEESPQQFTARKFSRTLNFNQIPTTSVDMDVSVVKEPTETKLKSRQQPPADDSPLYYFKANSKTLETTTDIDRSLAEYLKAEAAATLYRNNSMAKECRPVSSEDEEFYDAEESFVEEPQQPAVMCQVPQKPGNFLEESGMQPLQKSAESSVVVGEKMSRTVGTRSSVCVVTENKENIQPMMEAFETPMETSIPPEEQALPSENKENIQPMMGAFETPMETSIPPEEQALPSEKPKETLYRKTMHFTDENAVDESFFDEKQTNLAPSGNQRHRHTLYFNEPGNPSADMDTDRTFSKSKAVESVREMLRENLFLFNKFKQPKPTAFENKRLTVFSVGMDITTPDQEAMKFESPKVSSAENEGTPTKSRQSRIPQLIGSAQKLQSMKKSIEFIQQELPNLGSRGEITPEKNSTSRRVNDYVEDPAVAETPRRVANSLSLAAYRCGSTEKQQHNYQEYFNARGMKQRVTSYEPKNLQESFETVEIPRRVTGYAARNIPDSPVVSEIPGKDEEPKHYDESFETVDILRRVSNFHKNETLHLCPDEIEATNPHRKSVFQFDDAPITVSDVSTYFAQNRLSKAERTIAPTSPNTTEALCNLDVDRIADETQLPKSLDSDDATHTNLANFQKLYVELTCDSIMLEQTHLSLINTLDEPSELGSSVRPSMAPPAVDVAPLKPVSSVCRKCKKHRLSVTQNETTIGSFMIEPDPEPEPILDFSELYELAKKPKIRHVAKIWRQKLRESDSFTISDDSQSIASDVRAKLDSFVADLEKQRLENAQQRQKEREEIKRQVSFLDTVRKELQNKPNWILNELLVAGNFLRFSHTQIRTFAILINFTKKDSRGIEVNFTDIQVGPNMYHKRGQWSPFEYALHYQLLVELPFDLRKLCPNSDRLFEMLDRVEEVIQSVLQTGKDMLHLVLTSPASLIREPSGVLYIRKYARTKSPQSGPKRTEFQIQVRNIRKLSFESIILPPLYEFDEKIQLLPVGLDFLRMFLAEPMCFMKT